MPNFFIFGNIYFTPNGYDPWQAAYTPLEKHVIEAEHETCLTYYFGTPLEYGGDHSRANHMLAFEQYGKRADLYETHLGSDVIKVFLDEAPKYMLTGLDLRHYENVIGFLDKSGTREEAGIIYNTGITTKSGHREDVIEKLRAVVDEAEREDGTMTFLVLRCLDDEVGVRIFERYRDRRAVEGHTEGQALLSFWMGNKEGIMGMEGRAYVPTGRGWLKRGPSVQ